jgi:hypothetical protein
VRRMLFQLLKCTAIGKNWGVEVDELDEDCNALMAIMPRS